MLAHGEWPEWCGYCRGSGRVHCALCFGEGKAREPIGFRLPYEK